MENAHRFDSVELIVVRMVLSIMRKLNFVDPELLTLLI